MVEKVVVLVVVGVVGGFVGAVALGVVGAAIVADKLSKKKKTDSSWPSTRSNTTTDHQPATIRRRNTPTASCDSDYKIDPEHGGLLCNNMECLFIGSFGDKHGVKVIPKRFYKLKSPHLPGVKEDLKTMKSNIDKDPSKTFVCSLVDRPEDQHPKREYLQKIANFLTKCKTPGGEAFN